MGISLFSRFDHFFLCRIQPAVADVIEDRIVKKKSFLGDHPDLFTQRTLLNVVDVPSVKLDHASLGFVKPKKERENRALFSSTGTNQRIISTRLDMQAETPERCWQTGPISEGHVFKLDFACAS